MIADYLPALQLEDDIWRFVAEECYFPTARKLDEPFDEKFKLVVTIRRARYAYHAFVGVTWKGVHHALGITEKPVEAGKDYTLTMTWKTTPTTREFLEAFKEPLTKRTTTYSYTWIAGYYINGRGEIRCSLPAELTVEVPKIWMPILVGVGAVGIAGGLAYAALKK